MGNQIIKQPNGKYALWSTVVDDFVGKDLMREEIIEDMVETERVWISDRVNRICDQLDKGEKPYFQFTKSWEEALRIRNSVHGKRKKEKA